MNPEIAVRHVGSVAIVDMTGRFTRGESCSLLRDTVKGLLESRCQRILLSVKGVSYIDSCGLGELAGCYVTAVRMGGQLKILSGHGKVNDMLQVTRLFTVLVTFSDEADAIHSFLSSGSANSAWDSKATSG